MKWTWLAAALALLAPTAARAEEELRAPATPPAQARPDVGIPKKFANATITQKLDAQVRLDLDFVDEDGAPVKLGQYFNGRPVLLVLAYYRCPSLCQSVLKGMVERLRLMWRYQAGRNYEVVVVSFDPEEAQENARQTKAVFLESLGAKRGAPEGCHFLRGDKKNIDALCDAVGFGYAWDEEKHQYVHSSGVMVLTPTGKVSKYLLGLAFSEENLRDAIENANKGEIGTVARALLIFCGGYDGKMGMIVYRVVQVLGAFFGLAVILCLGWQLCNIYGRREPTL